MNRNNGITLIILVIIITILTVIAGIAVYFAIGDNGVISKTIKMDVEATRRRSKRSYFITFKYRITFCF